MSIKIVTSDPLKSTPMLTGNAPVSKSGNVMADLSIDGLSMHRLFPGHDGIPFRLTGDQRQAPMLKNDDPEHMQPMPVADAHVRIFDMSKDIDVSEYAQVWDSAAKGTVLISAEERHWSDKTQNFLIFLRWGELFLELPKGGADAHRTFSS